MHYSIFSHEDLLQYKPTMYFGSLTYGKKIRQPHTIRHNNMAPDMLAIIVLLLKFLDKSGTL